MLVRDLNTETTRRRIIKKVLRPKIVLRLSGICFFGCLTGFLWFDSPYWMAGIWTALITGALFYDTMRFVDQSERKLIAFLQSLQQNDFSVTFSENKKSNDYDLHHAFNLLNETFKILRSEKEVQHQLLKDKNLKLVALHDVSSELSAKEAEAWQRLLKVLTHEISNSAIPLSTLSSYIYEMVITAEAENRKLNPEERQDILESLKTIDQRSRSLKEFVQNFRSVNQIPEPDLKRISIKELIAEVVPLFAKDLKSENIGCGIPSEDIDQIFIPFYSTKKSGSGIGLSISQQIMQKQKGDISVQSVPGRGSVFTLTFIC